MSQTTFEKFGVSVKKKRKKKEKVEVKEVITTPREPEIDYDKIKREKLAKLHLCYGSTHVYKYEGKILGTGDLRCYPDGIMVRDIFHNFKVLRKMILKKRTVNYLGKAYDADMYEDKLSKKEMLDKLLREAEEDDKHIYEITEDGILDYHELDPLHIDEEWVS